MATIDTTKKCVIVEGWRAKDGTVYRDMPLKHEVTVTAALESLVKYELGFGGGVTEIEERNGRVRIFTETIVFKICVKRCRDTMVFEGTIKDMRPLVEAAYYWSKALKYDEIAFERISQILDPDGKGVSPLILTTAAPLLMGQSRVAISMLLACGLKEQADIERGLKVKDGDLRPAIELWLEQPGRQFTEVLDQIGV